MTANAARAQWEVSNNIITSDAHWHVDKQKMESMYAQRPRPWVQEAQYFTSVRMSALAALKILMHAKTGHGKKGRIGNDKNNWIEVMGLVQGHFFEHTLVITDSFGLPVDASEVECSMNEHSIAYMLAHLDYASSLGKPDAGCVGWYHSHPGYSCFLSGIDVNTQRNNQSVQDPWVAIVVDPVQTAATGKIEIRAFRTLPERSGGGANNSAVSKLSMDTSSIPPEKIAELGVYVNEYYELPITIVRSVNDARQLDLLWSKYWMNLLATASPLVANRYFTTRSVAAISMKLEKGGAATAQQRGGANASSTASPDDRAVAERSGNGVPQAAPEWLRGTQALVGDVLQGIVLEQTKHRLFSVGSGGGEQQPRK